MSIMKRIVEEAIVRNELLDGQHVHWVRSDRNTYCEGGDPECPLWGIQLREAMESWA